MLFEYIKLFETMSTCGICLKDVLKEQDLLFGMLPNCNHIFCMQCIETWRQQFHLEYFLTCPECRTPCDYVYPVREIIDEKLKREYINSEKEKMKKSTCQICLKDVLKKQDPLFGMLPNCNHLFCLQCIKNWRQRFNFGISKTCPECKALCDFVYPVREIINDDIRKKEYMNEENKKMRKSKNYQFVFSFHEDSNLTEDEICVICAELTERYLFILEDIEV